MTDLKLTSSPPVQACSITVTQDEDKSVEQILQETAELKKEIDAQLARNKAVLDKLVMPTKDLYILFRHVPGEGKLMLAICTNKQLAEEYKKEYIQRMKARDTPSLFAFFYYQMRRGCRTRALCDGKTQEEIDRETIKEWQDDICKDRYCVKLAKQYFKRFLWVRGGMKPDDGEEGEGKSEADPSIDVSDLSTSGDVHNAGNGDITSSLQISHFRALSPCYPYTVVETVEWHPSGDGLVGLEAVTYDAYKAEAIADGLQKEKGKPGWYIEYYHSDFPLDMLVWQ